MHNKLMKITSRAMLVVMCGFTLPMQTAQAGMVGTEQIVAGHADRARAMAFMEREDVSQAIEKQGVSAAEAKARVAAMTDAEIAQLNQRIDQMPAGGDGVLGLLFTVFIILLVTDILGFTKVFPFTRPIR